MDKLVERLEDAEKALSEEDYLCTRGHLEKVRLKGKLDGIRLALSYAREMR